MRFIFNQSVVKLAPRRCLKAQAEHIILLIVCLLVDNQIPALASCAFSILMDFSEIHDKNGLVVIHWQ
jgi:hypothetical protein